MYENIDGGDYKVKKKKRRKKIVVDLIGDNVGVKFLNSRGFT